MSDFIGMPVPSPYIRLHIAVGDPATMLLILARDATLLIVGTRSKPSQSPCLLGRVSQQVAVHACCPVLLVPRVDAHEVIAANSGRAPVP
ncbi:universal stress protein [Krasilnikovia cinnamomea]|uniref:universal stress protein n=1 Tax=Krasilnikovia cinnamomea TaxID=349313 RepID=UPI0013EEEA35|nr:universal stress protein [Krasilnikovia cinnamomea]